MCLEDAGGQPRELLTIEVAAVSMSWFFPRAEDEEEVGQYWEVQDGQKRQRKSLDHFKVEVAKVKEFGIQKGSGVFVCVRVRVRQCVCRSAFLYASGGIFCGRLCKAFSLAEALEGLRIWRFVAEDKEAFFAKATEAKEAPLAEAEEANTSKSFRRIQQPLPRIFISANAPSLLCAQFGCAVICCVI